MRLKMLKSQFWVKKSILMKTSLVQNSAFCLHFQFQNHRRGFIRNFNCLFTFPIPNQMFVFISIRILAVCLHFCKNFLLDGLNEKNIIFNFWTKIPFCQSVLDRKKKAEERCFNKIFFYRSTCRFLCPKPILKRKMLIQSLRLMRSMRSTKNKYQKKAPQNCCFLK